MQTFVPYGFDFQLNAKSLDRQRLGKQRVEAFQILNTITGLSAGWRNHPAVKMWQGYPEALAQYGADMCREWISRGYKDSLLPRFELLLPTSAAIFYPDWLTRSDVMLSHRSNLIRKMPEHYSMLWPDIPNDIPYVWPA